MADAGVFGLGGGEALALGFDLGALGGGKVELIEAAVKVLLEGELQDQAHGGDGEQAGKAGDGVVDAGGDAGLGDGDGVHDGGGEGRDRDGHADAEDEDGGEPGGPIRAANAGAGGERETGGGDEGADGEGESSAVFADEAAGPF